MRKLHASARCAAALICMAVTACATPPARDAATIGAGATSAIEDQPIADPPRIWGHFESQAAHQRGGAVEIYDDRIVLAFATYYTERVGAFDASQPWRAGSSESWAQHWVFSDNDIVLEHFIVAELRRVTRVEARLPINLYCGPKPTAFFVVAEGRRPETTGYDDVRAVIAPFDGEPRETTQCGFDSYFGAARTPQP